MTSAPRSIFRMNLNILALFFSIAVIPFHALSLSYAEPSTLLIIQHLHPYSQISNLPKSLYRTIRMSTSRLAASCIATQFLQHAPPIRIFVTFSPALGLVSQHCKPVTSYTKSHDCSATYCGQTSRPLHKRITEHERYTRPAYSHATDLQQSSALAQHAHASGHQIDFSSAVILAKLQHQQQLDLVKHAAITVLEPSLNRNHAAPSINPQWHPILQSISEQFHPITIT